MTDIYQDVVWSPPLRQKDAMPSAKHDLVAAPPVKWPLQPVALIHPAVFPSFKTPVALAPTTSIDLPPGAYAMIIKKPSLFLLGFGLMLLGVCFFSSGFFLGMWIGGKSASQNVASAQGGPSGSGASTSRFGTFLGLAGTAMGGKAGRLAFAGQRAANKEARQQGRGAPAGAGTPSQNPSSSPNTASNATATLSEDGNSIEAEGEERLQVEDEASGPVSSIKYTIQLGSFVTKENAQDLMMRLKEKQFSVYLVESIDMDGGPIFCVRSGTFNRFIFAETALSTFFDYGISAIVVAVKPTDKRLLQ